MPHWEHGYRCHGYWHDELTRFGVVSLGPRNLVERPLAYGWRVDVPGFPRVEGRTRTLRHAKKQVELLVASMLAILAPGELEREVEAVRRAWQ